MASTSILRPGTEIIGLDGAKYPSAYSSFAISVDSRAAETSQTPDILHEKPSGRPVSAMKHGKSVSANPEYGIYSYGGYGKRRDSGPDGPAFPSSTSKTFGVRFNNADATMKRSNQHHRRSSTAAVIEYIRRQIDGESVEKTSIAFTAKRAFLLFCIVFSATYLAFALLPLVAGSAGSADRVKLVTKRGPGYYGNSNIFQGGNGLGDPHAEGDEHHHFVAHQAATDARAAVFAKAGVPESKKAKVDSVVPAVVPAWGPASPLA
ncbi:MAG: hypothetical protein CYPHOPRED_003916, partial [Cyphobasidiales sp. Tagirdzhanova-0007]